MGGEVDRRHLVRQRSGRRLGGGCAEERPTLAREEACDALDLPPATGERGQGHPAAEQLLELGGGPGGSRLGAREVA